MQGSRKGYLILTLVGTLVCIVCVGGIIYPLTVQLTLPSARDALDRFAHMPPDRPDDVGVVRQTLLQDLPVGTTERDIYAFIQQRGGTLDNSGSAACHVNHIRNDLRDKEISCYFQPDPAKINFPCLTAYIVTFTTDKKEVLADITIREGGACL
jgi:hypothetical protein